MSNKLKLSKNINGKFVVVGELAFGPKGEPTLTVQDKGPAGDQLRAAWAEVSKMPKVLMKWSELDPADKTGATQLLKGKEVPKGDPDYPTAVADILSRNYGFFGTPTDLA
jgi:hypothetical protein